MTPKRKPLIHSKSLYQPPLTRSSLSSPGPNPPHPNRSPIFSHSASPTPSCRSDPHLSQANKPELKGCRSYSLSSRRSTLRSQRCSQTAQTSQDKAGRAASVGTISEQFSAFVNMSSQMGLQVNNAKVEG